MSSNDSRTSVLKKLAMTKSREESQRATSFAISGALLLLLSLGYLFVPRSELESRSPLSVLISPNKKFFFECIGEKAPKGSPLLYLLADNSKEDCFRVSGRWIQVKASDGSVLSTGLGRSDIGSLLSKDLPATGGLLLLIGVSPALGFFVFQRIAGARR